MRVGQTETQGLSGLRLPPINWKVASVDPPKRLEAFSETLTTISHSQPHKATNQWGVHITPQREYFKIS